MTVTQLKELRKQQQMMLEKKMIGEDSDEEEEMDPAERKGNTSSQDEEVGCTWGMGKKLKLLPAGNILNSLLVAPLNVFNHTAFYDSLRQIGQIQFAYEVTKTQTDS